MSRGTIVFILVMSVGLIAVAGILNMLARNNDEGALRDTLYLLTELRQVSLDQGTGPDMPGPLVAVFDRLDASIPDLPVVLVEEVGSLIDATRHHVGVLETYATTLAALAEASRAWRSSAVSLLGRLASTGNEALASVVLTLMRDMNRFLDGAGGIPNHEVLREASWPPEFVDVAASMTLGASTLVADKAKVDALLEQASEGQIATLSGQLAILIETELERRHLLADTLDNGTAAALGALVLFWILLGLRQSTRPQPEPAGNGRMPGRTRTDVPDPGFLARSVAAALALRAERIAERTNALRLSRLRLKSALEESGLDRSLHDDVPLREEIKAMEDVLLALRSETGALSGLGKRLESLARTLTPAGDHEPGTMDLNACLREALDATGAGNVMKDAGQIADVPAVRGVHIDIVLALTRIVDSALDVANAHDNPQDILQVGTAVDNGEVHVTVSVTGNGWMPGVSGNTFRALHAPSGGGPDPGLALAAGLVERHGGTMRIEPVSGQQTTVRLSFPGGLT